MCQDKFHDCWFSSFFFFGTSMKKTFFINLHFQRFLKKLAVSFFSFLNQISHIFSTHLLPWSVHHGLNVLKRAVLESSLEIVSDL